MAPMPVQGESASVANSFELSIIRTTGLLVDLTARQPNQMTLNANSEEKRQAVSDIDAVAVDSLKALDPKRPIREADIKPLRSRPFRSVSQSQSTWPRYPHRPFEIRSISLSSKSEGSRR